MCCCFERLLVLFKFIVIIHRHVYHSIDRLNSVKCTSIPTDLYVANDMLF